MVWLMGVIEGLLITAILVVNNLRDIESDRQTGKRTLAVIIGIRGSTIEYVLLLAGAYAIPIILWVSISLPIAVYLMRLIWKNSDGSILNQALAKTATLALVYSLLMAVGVIL
jgi:1,4-dihydroxy-2-naphthoate octaprenyltransferase